MTPEKEIEILRWLNDNYPNHESSVVKVWELIKILYHYHNSEVKKLNEPAVSNQVCPTHGTMLYKHPNGLAYCSLCNYSISWQTCC